MMTLIEKADEAGRYIEDTTFRTVALVAACVGFFFIALIGIRGEDTRSEAGATKEQASALSVQLDETLQKLDQNAEHERQSRANIKVNIRDIKQNIADIQVLLRNNGFTPSGD